MTTATKDAMNEPTKNERVATVKHLFDSANSLKSAATTHNTLFSFRSMTNYDVSMIARLLMDAVSKTPINSLEELSADMCSIHWLAFEKNREKSLRKAQSQSH